MEINRKALIGLAVIIFSLFAVLFLAYEIIGSGGQEFLFEIWTSLKVTLLNNGLWLFASIAVLPGFILPVAPLLTLAGLWAEEHGPWTACFYSCSALSLNLSWTYWLARGPGRKVILNLLKQTRHQLPAKVPVNLLQWAIVLRLTPGMPFVFSNYGLGILRMPFHSYLLVSIPIICITGCGYILAFAGIFGGNWTYSWAGLSLIIIMVIIGRILLKGKRNAN